MINGVKYATVNVDGSYKNGRASYATWIIGDNFIIRKAAELKGTFESSNAAEMAAVINALCVLSKVNPLYFDKIVINTDSKHAIDYFILQGNVRDRERKLNSRYSRYIEIYKNITKRFNGKPIKFKKVKSHTTGLDG